jgi:MoaA/NifB/PqqE/SkfB family radical SAM enzyme
MTIDDKIKELQRQYKILHVVDLDPWHDEPIFLKLNWLHNTISQVYKEAYGPNERIIFTLTRGDIYESADAVAGQLITHFQQQLNKIDVGNFFVILLTNDSVNIPVACDWAHNNISADPVPFTCIPIGDQLVEKTVESCIKNASLGGEYNSLIPLKISMDQLDDKEKYLLTKSPTFCMYPWIHLHAYPTGAAYPCCQAEMAYPVGDCRNNSLEEIWNGDPMKQIRQKMLTDRPVSACTRCYEQENSGFFSGRQSANKHHGHHINTVAETQPDGTLDKFALTYWDIRFSNLCNLSCRSCGHIFSSSWYADQVKLAGKEWQEKNKVLNYAGRTETDIWEQLVPHLDYVEQIYFAGGEPLMMKEHYNILDELERRGRFDVRLIYNTNFTHVKLKDRLVFDYWKKFDSVAVGASLDAMGPRAEYIRKGTDWDQIEHNREQMLKICPEVDFYISPTLSIMNAWHLPDFHRNWIDKGYIRPQDLNVNILQDPTHYRIDIAPPKYKQRLRLKFEEHIEWLRPLDQLRRATVGFESAINFMLGTDNTVLLSKFWKKTHELDAIRKENILEVIPELEAIQL